MLTCRRVEMLKYETVTRCRHPLDDGMIVAATLDDTVRRLGRDTPRNSVYRLRPCGGTLAVQLDRGNR